MSVCYVCDLSAASNLASSCKVYMWFVDMLVTSTPAHICRYPGSINECIKSCTHCSRELNNVHTYPGMFWWKQCPLSDFCNAMVVGLVWVFQKLLGFVYRTFCWVCTEWCKRQKKKKTSNKQQFCAWTWLEIWPGCPDWFKLTGRWR